MLNYIIQMLQLFDYNYKYHYLDNFLTNYIGEPEHDTKWKEYKARLK